LDVHSDGAFFLVAALLGWTFVRGGIVDWIVYSRYTIYSMYSTLSLGLLISIMSFLYGFDACTPSLPKCHIHPETGRCNLIILQFVTVVGRCDGESIGSRSG